MTIVVKVRLKADATYDDDRGAGFSRTGVYVASAFGRTAS
jgi:hypothetical protein